MLWIGNKTAYTFISILSYFEVNILFLYYLIISDDKCLSSAPRKILPGEYARVFFAIIIIIKLRPNLGRGGGQDTAGARPLTGRRINKSQLRELMQRVILSPRPLGPPDARVKAFLSRIVAGTITPTIPPRL